MTHTMPHTFLNFFVNFKELSVANLSTFCALISHLSVLPEALQPTAAGFMSQVQSETPAPQPKTHSSLFHFHSKLKNF